MEMDTESDELAMGLRARLAEAQSQYAQQIRSIEAQATSAAASEPVTTSSSQVLRLHDPGAEAASHDGPVAACASSGAEETAAGFGQWRREKLAERQAKQQAQAQAIPTAPAEAAPSWRRPVVERVRTPPLETPELPTAAAADERVAPNATPTADDPLATEAVRSSGGGGGGEERRRILAELPAKRAAAAARGAGYQEDPLEIIDPAKQEELEAHSRRRAKLAELQAKRDAARERRAQEEIASRAEDALEAAAVAMATSAPPVQRSSAAATARESRSSSKASACVTADEVAGDDVPSRLSSVADLPIAAASATPTCSDVALEGPSETRRSAAASPSPPDPKAADESVPEEQSTVMAKADEVAQHVEEDRKEEKDVKEEQLEGNVDQPVAVKEKQVKFSSPTPGDGDQASAAEEPTGDNMSYEAFRQQQRQRQRPAGRIPAVPPVATGPRPHLGRRVAAEHAGPDAPLGAEGSSSGSAACASSSEERMRRIQQLQRERGATATMAPLTFQTDVPERKAAAGKTGGREADDAAPEAAACGDMEGHDGRGLPQQPPLRKEAAQDEAVAGSGGGPGGGSGPWSPSSGYPVSPALGSRAEVTIFIPSGIDAHAPQDGDPVIRVRPRSREQDRAESPRQELATSVAPLALQLAAPPAAVEDLKMKWLRYKGDMLSEEKPPPPPVEVAEGQLVPYVASSGQDDEEMDPQGPQYHDLLARWQELRGEDDLPAGSQFHELLAPVDVKIELGLPAERRPANSVALALGFDEGDTTEEENRLVLPPAQQPRNPVASQQTPRGSRHPSPSVGGGSAVVALPALVDTPRSKLGPQPSVTAAAGTPRGKPRQKADECVHQ